MFRRALFVSLVALVAVPVGAFAQDAAPATFVKRGVYYFDGAARCPLAGIGTRGPKACNRVALDDDHSSVSVDRAAHQIVVLNQHLYPKKQVIADVLFLTTGLTKAGQRVPVGVHLKIEKKGKSFSPHVHAHLTVRDDMASAELEPYRVVLSDGAKESIALDPAGALASVRDPGAMAKLANIFIEVKDNLDNKDGNAAARTQSPRLLSDVSIGLGLGKLSKMVLRAQLETGDAAAKGSPVKLTEMFASGTWAVRLTSLSSLLPKDVLARELFLFGMGDLPILAGVRKDGLKKGETLVFGVKDGQGTITVGNATEPLPDAVDKGRAFLELCFIGAILEHQATLAVAP